MRRSLSEAVFVCILFAASLLTAQNAATSLRGVIKDPSGAVVAGAKISIVNFANGSTFNTVADSMGGYVFPQIPPARYSITVTATGFGS